MGYTRYDFKLTSYMNSFHPHNNPIGWIVLLSLSSEETENQGEEGLGTTHLQNPSF